MRWQLFCSVFALIFLAEIPDKTAFAILFMAARGRALAIFVGTAAAFLVQTVVATAFGSFISAIPQRYVECGAGLLFLGFAISAWRKRDEEAQANPMELSAVGLKTFWAPAWRAFLVIFVAEWGDLTQLATASLVARFPNDKLTVFTGSLLALWSATALAIFLGLKLSSALSGRWIRRAGAAIFAAIGFYFLFMGIRG